MSYANWIDAIISNAERNKLETRTFICIYRKLISPSELFVYWTNRLESLKDVAAQESAMNFLLTWIEESYLIDFNKEERMLLIESIPSFPVKRNELQLLLIRIAGPKKLKFQNKIASTHSVVSPKKMGSFGFSRSPSFDGGSFPKEKGKATLLRPSTSFLSEEVVYLTIFSKFTPEQMAEALTVECSLEYRKLKAVDIISKIGWKNHVKTEKSGKKKNSLDSLTKNFNELSGWVTNMIIMEICRHPQKQIIEGMIKMAKRCEQLNNFDGCMAILSGLNNFAVQRLKTTWEMIDEKERMDYQYLESLMNPGHNFRKYSEEIASRKGPSIPFIGLLLRDFTFIAENELTNGGQVNQEVFKMLEKRIHFIWERQSEQYDLPSNHDVVLNHMRRGINIIKDDELLYKQSLLSEPSQDELSVDDNSESTDNFETVSVGSGSTSSSLSSSNYAWPKGEREEAFVSTKKSKEKVSPKDRSTLENSKSIRHKMSAKIKGWD